MPDPSDLILTCYRFICGWGIFSGLRPGGRGGGQVVRCGFFTLHWCGHGDFFEKIVTHIADPLTSRA